MFERTSERAKRVMVWARDEAGKLGHPSIGTEHLLLAVLREGHGPAHQVLGTFGVDHGTATERLVAISGRGRTRVEGRVPFTPRALHVIELSAGTGIGGGVELIDPEHILLGLIEEGEGTGIRVLTDLGADPAAVRELVRRSMKGRTSRELKYRSVGRSVEQMQEELRAAGGWQGSSSGRTESTVMGSGSVPRTGGVVRGGPRDGAPATFHGVLVRDLTHEAREGQIGPVVGFAAEHERILRALGRRSGANVLVVGDPGVGKTALVEGLALQQIEKSYSELPSRGPLHRITLQAALGRSQHRGSAWLDEALTEFAQRAVTPFFDDLHRVVPGGRPQPEIADLLSMMSEAAVPVIAAITSASFDEHLAADAQLLRRFQVIRLAEPSPAKVLEILKALRGVYERHHEVRIVDGALKAAARVASGGAAPIALPGRAVGVLDEAAALVRLRRPTSTSEIDEITRRIAGVRRLKAAAVEAQDFEDASRLRGEERKLQEARNKATAKRKPSVVDEAVVGEVAASLSGA